MDNVSNNVNLNSAWQSILKALDMRTTPENKDAIDTVKEQLQPFLADSQDDDIALSIDGAAQARIGDEQIHVTQAIAEMFNNSLSEGNVDRINLNDYDVSVSEDGKTYTFKMKQPNDGTMVLGSNSYIMKLNDDGTYTVNVSRNDFGSAPYDKTFSSDGRLIKEHWNSSASLGPGGQDYTAIYNSDGSKVETRVYNSPESNNNVKTEIKTTNKDGSYTVTTKDVDGKVIENKKYDKDGKEITTDTPKVQEGEKGSVEYITSLMDIDAKNIDNKTVEKNNQGRITKFEAGSWTYNITYSDNGDTVVEKLPFVNGKITAIGLQTSITTFNKDNEKVQVKIIGTSVGYNTVQEFSKGKLVSEAKMYGNSDNPREKTTYNSDGTTTVQYFNENGSVTGTKKYDKDGNEIKDTGDTPKVKEGEKGSVEYLNSLNPNWNIYPDDYEITYDEKGRAIYLTPQKSNKGLTVSGTTYSISYNDESGEVTVSPYPYNILGAASHSYTYNANKELVRENISNGSLGPGDKPKVIEYNPDGTKTETIYDASGNVIETKKFDKDGKEIKDSGETPKIKEGEVGSVEYIKNLLGEDFINGEITTNEQGYVASIYKRGNPNLNGPGSYDFEIKVEYGEDGSIAIKKYKYGFDGTKLYFDRKFDKDGKEIKDSGETTKVKEGEKGSLSYLKSLIGNIDESLGVQYYEYDDKGRIKSMSNCDFSSGLICNSDITYKISYADNGDVIVDCSGFVAYVRKMPASTIYHTDGSYDVTDKDGKVTKFDKDGKEIKDTGDTPKVKEGEAGSLAWIKENYYFNLGLYDIKYDEKGRISKLTANEKASLVNTIVVDYIVEYNADGSGRFVPSGLNSSYGKIMAFDKDGKKIKDTPQETKSTTPTQPTTPTKPSVPKPTRQTPPTRPTVPGWGGGSSWSGGGSSGGSTGSYGSSSISIWRSSLRNIFSNIFSNSTTSFYNRMSGFLKDIFRR